MSDENNEQRVRTIAEQLSKKNITPEVIAGYEMLQAAVTSLQCSVDRGGAPNYIELVMFGLIAPFDRAAVHLLRPGGRTPSELRRVAEAQIGDAVTRFKVAEGVLEEREAECVKLRARLAKACEIGLRRCEAWRDLHGKSTTSDAVDEQANENDREALERLAIGAP